MEKFLVRFTNAEDAIPASWKELPLPKTPSKRPVGRPHKRKPEEEETPSKRQRVESACETSEPDSNENLQDTPKRGKYKQFSVKEKLDICDYARTHGVRVAARAYKLGKSTIQSWMKVDFEEQRTKLGHLQRTGRPLTYSKDIDSKICSYVLEQRDLQNAVSVDELCLYAKSKIEPSNPDFKASRCWATKFMKRHDLVLRAKTSVAQRLPADLEEKISSFQKFVGQQREMDEFDDRFIINMDETPVYFDLVPGKTIETKGAKTVKIRTTGNEKRHFTVVLAVSASGDVLPPMIIFKGKRALDIPHPPNWIVTVQEKGWMDEELMRMWVKDILLKFTGKERTLLVMDSFRAHICDSIKKQLRKGNVVPAVIPGGCTSKLQPLDVCINKPFKAEVRKCWGQYMKDAIKTTAPGDKIKAATKETVVEWLNSAVKYIEADKQLVIKSFKICGISNALNGSEDSVVRSDSVSACLDSDDDEEEFEGFDEDDLPLSDLIK